MEAARILVVEHDPGRAGPLVAALAEVGYRVDWRMDAFAGLVAVEDLRPALVVLNWQLPFVDGYTFVRVLCRALAQPPPVIALVARGDPAVAVAAGAYVGLAASADLEPIVAAARALLPRGGEQA